jgi:hypothetical protein
VGAYSSSGGGGRPVGFLLPGGESVDVRANEVTFQLNDSPQGVDNPTTGKILVPKGRTFWLRVDAPAVEGADAGVAAYQEALEATGLPTDSASELQQTIAAGPTGRPGDNTRRTAVGASPPPERRGWDSGSARSSAQARSRSCSCSSTSRTGTSSPSRDLTGIDASGST